MSPKRQVKKIGKRKNTSTQNVSGEKPNKKTLNTTHASTSNVNKNKNNGSQTKPTDTSKQIVKMDTFNVPVYDSPVIQHNRHFHQYPLSQQPIQNPNFTQPSPTLPNAGFYTSTPQNVQSCS